MFKKILLGLVIIIAGILVVAAFQPDDFKVTRSGSMSAPAATVFVQVNDLHKWEAWSPWAKLDPAMKQTFEGPAAGPGAVYSWASEDSKVGHGRMTIVESRPNELIRMKLEFIKPFAATNDVEFAFKEEGNQTSVTWSMAGQKNFMFKAVGLFMNCDKMIGGDFEKGLANLKAVAESAAGNNKQTALR
jgi:hypothetical protein